MHHLTRGQKRALRQAAELAHQRDHDMAPEDRDVHYLECRTNDLRIVVGGAVAHGWITIDEIGEPAREMIANVSERMKAILESMENDPPREESDPYTPDAVVSLGKIVSEMDFVGPEIKVYLNRRTGEVRVMSDEALSDAEDDIEVDDDAPDWQKKQHAEAIEILDGDDWIDMPSHYDLDEYRAMTKFARNQRPSVSKALDQALHGRGAYRRFRNEIHELGLVDEWHEYRREWIADLVRSELEEHDIPFRR